ncbi:hypothetical protein C3409_23650 [Klebsiella oxytoca]|nr:hypothetical protein C2U44_29730 [Klebsiella oxytoca]POT86339.1 hypothetical protein C3417_21395 [Klebsiella oxytoca]POV48622.1 hypothetical protein C3409_23650 [Klebsiella oxytoca]
MGASLNVVSMVFDEAILLHPSRCLFVGCTRSPQSLTFVSSWRFPCWPSRHIMNDLAYKMRHLSVDDKHRKTALHHS